MASHVQEATDASYLSSAPTLTYSPMGSEFAGGVSQEKSAQPAELPPIIPPTHPYRTLVLCFDGTGDQFDSDNSNIVELFQMLRKDDQDKQMVYYQAGIGTYVWPKVATPFATKISKTLDEAIAWNLDAHLMDGYSFLMQNYKAGDKICIFGFSRGAYTARSLAGMIHKVGLLPACNHQQVPFAYKMYTKTTEQGWAQSNAFKKAFSVDVPIEFVGVWETVNSVGLIPKTLPFSTSNTIVKTFRHAVSLDERRAKFKANLWNRPNKEEQQLGVEGQKPIYHHNSVDEAMLKAQQEHEAHEGHDHRPAPKKNGSSGILDKIGVDNKPKVTQKQMETKYSGKADKETDVEEVWFSGCHCDVGGGSVSNDTPHSLARIPLRWMIRECFKTNSGIMFSSEGIRKSGLDPANLYPIVRKRPEALPTTGLKVQKIPSTGFFSKKPEPVEPSSACLTEEEHELHDALSPKYDQLSIAKTWWILEIWPVKQRYQKGNKEWVRYWKCNMGQGRFIPKQASRMIKVHRSVRMRMETEKEGSKSGKKYRPKADFKRALSVDHIEWVD